LLVPLGAKNLFIFGVIMNVRTEGVPRCVSSTAERQFYIYCRRTCPRRSLDSGRIYNYLTLNGWKAAKDIKQAELIIVYTCGGFSHTEKRSLLTIKRAITQKKKDARLVITGCLVKINPKVINGFGDALIVAHEHLHTLDHIIQAKITYEAVPDVNIVPDIQDLDQDRVSLSLALKRFVREFRFTRAYVGESLRFVKGKIISEKKAQGVFPDGTYNLKIAHGCLGKCSYCAIKFATGKLKSKPIERILEEFERGLAKGYKRFVLIAEDTGCYGLDIGINIVALLDRIFDVERDFSIMINDFNANWLIKYYDDLLPLFIKNKDKIEDIRIPIQSGSDRILKLMKRPYRIDNVKKAISDLKAKVPNLKINTHMLVGFPGETDLDFEQSRQIPQQLEFAKISVYSYEERPGTKASLLPNKVPLHIRNKRASALRKIS